MCLPFLSINVTSVFCSHEDLSGCSTGGQLFRYLKTAHVLSDLHLSAFAPVSSRSFTNLISFLKFRCQPEYSRAVLMISLFYSLLNALLVDVALSLYIELEFNKSYFFCMYHFVHISLEAGFLKPHYLYLPSLKFMPYWI